MNRLRQTHTYAALEISKAAWDEIAGKLREAGYQHAFDLEEKAIDMHGIGIVAEEPHKGDEDGNLHCVCSNFQAPAAAMCPRCPTLRIATARDLQCWQMVMELRANEVESVEILADNADGEPNCAVDCHGEWTGWAVKRFEGKTLHEALSAAVAAKRKAQT